MNPFEEMLQALAATMESLAEDRYRSFTQNIATVARNLYDDLVEEGFNDEQALQIVASFASRK